MNLKHLTDKTLLTDTKRLVRQERELIATVLWHLKEIDARRLYSDMKYPSLFEYCVRELGYSESSAQRRIGAARLLKEMPEIAPKIARGELTLTTVGLVNSAFEADERREMLKQVENKTAAETKEIIRIAKKEERTYTVTMDETTFRQWQELKNLGVDLDLVISQAKKTKLNSKLKREVYQRDEGKCQNCGSLHRVEFDHRKPKALGGKDSADNLRLLCRSCNQRKRIDARLLRCGSKLLSKKKELKGCLAQKRDQLGRYAYGKNERHHNGRANEKDSNEFVRNREQSFHSEDLFQLF